MATGLREAVANADDVAAVKRSIVGQIYRVLSIHLGTPPGGSSGRWTDKDNTFHREGEFTPQEFAAQYVPGPGRFRVLGQRSS